MKNKISVNCNNFAMQVKYELEYVGIVLPHCFVARKVYFKRFTPILMEYDDR